MTGAIPFQARLTSKVTRREDRERAKRREIFRWRVRHFFVQRWREMPLEALLFVCGLLARVVPGFNMPMHGRLHAKVVRGGEVWDYGHVGVHLIVTAGKTFIRDAWANSVELENMKYHGVGTGTTAAAAGDTALQTESTTALNPDSTRATGSLTNNGAAVFRTVGTATFDASAAITEWGLLSQAATGGGTLFDRQVFSAINVVSGDSIAFTYDLTIG